MSLLKACFRGRLDVVKYLLSRTPSAINTTNPNGGTPVMVAARYGKKDVFDFLVSIGSDLNVVNNDKYTLLHTACIGGHTDIVQTLVDKQPDVDIRGGDGATPVLVAARYGHTQIVKLLAKNNCNLMTVDYFGDNILHCACFGGHVDTVKYILSEISVSKDSRNKGMQTPLMLAALMLVALLVVKGCSLTATDIRKNNILHQVCMRGQTHMARYIISLDKVSIESRGYHDCTPVLFAAKRGHTELVKLLIDKGCSLSVFAGGKSNVLHMACSSGHLETVKFILSTGKVNINSKEIGGRTALMISAMKGYKHIFNVLLRKGSNLAMSDNNGNTALHLASATGNIDIVRRILALTTYQMNVRNKFGQTPLDLAKFKGQRKIVNLLYEIGK